MTALIELRSDTFTRPTAGMRAAMAAAEVGDDMVSEDPTVNALEARLAAMFGKEAAVYACSGTQSNQMAIWGHVRPGDEILLERRAHIAVYESGGPAVLSGATVRTISTEDGRLRVEDLEGQIRRGNLHFAPTTLLCLENTTNTTGGRVYSAKHLAELASWAHANGLQVHLDGARIWNAAAATGSSLAELVQHVDSVSACFSKGLGCPMGSVVVGTHELVQRARRARKIFGGALRQAGIPAAAALYALDHHRERLRDDHANARALADGLANIPGLAVDLAAVETNIVIIHVAPGVGTAKQLASRLWERGVRLYDLGPQMLRAVTHLDVAAEDIARAIPIFAESLHDLASVRNDPAGVRS